MAKISIVILSILILLGKAEDCPKVKLDEADFTGIFLESYKGKTFNSFLGIPYAKPPIEDLRFKNPIPVDPYETDFKANNDSASCIQAGFPGGPTIIGQEDCLYLNVYTPLNFTNKKFDVLVFIHGGGYTFGAGTKLYYGPDYLLEHDIVLVTPNYRLGSLGFLTTEDENLPGNYGLKDIRLALKWIQKYITQFGGNPESVTIFGQSAGGVTCHLLTMAEEREGLFHRVVMTGGTAFDNRVFYYGGESLQVTKKFAAQFGCDSSSNKDMVQCLSQVSAYNLTEKSITFYIEFDGVDPMTPFRPTIEANVPGAFLVNNPFNVYSKGQVSDVPWIVGIAEREGGTRASLILQNKDDLKIMNENRDRIFPLTFSYRQTVGKNSQEVTDAIYSHYFHNKSVDESQTSQLINCYTDSQELSGLDFALRLNLNYLKSPLYFFTYNYTGTFSLTDTIGGLDYPEFRSSHGDELFYLFKMHPYYRAGKEPNEKDLKMSRYLTQILVNFMHKALPLGDKWAATTLPNLPYVTINGPCKIRMSGEDNEISKRMKFWHKQPYNVPLHQKSVQLEMMDSK